MFSEIRVLESVVAMGTQFECGIIPFITINVYSDVGQLLIIIARLDVRLQSSSITLFFLYLPANLNDGWRRTEF